MKLRIQGNSIRLRLSRSEVARLLDSGHVDEQAQFSSEALRYSLLRAPVEELQVDLVQGVLIVVLPDELARRWASSAQVGIEEQRGALHVLIEKDFQCVHGVYDTDAFDPEGLT